MRIDVNEHDEFLLSRLLDGDLPAAEADALRERFDREPALRSAFEQVRRIDDALKARRGDRATVDFGTFHASVMDSVRAETAPATIPFPRWRRLAAPLAAAAAIALVVSYVTFGPFGEPVTGEMTIDYHHGKPSSPARGDLLVHVTPQAASQRTGELRVDYARSSALAEAVREQDEAIENEPPTFVRAGVNSTQENAASIMLSPFMGS